MDICKHLSDILKTEIERGNSIVRIDKEKWTNAVLVINLEKEIDVKYIKTHINIPESVIIWENTDTHYPLDIRFFCSKCKHSIASPRSVK